MQIFVFRSEAQGELRAFAADASGSSLPARFQPWQFVGVILPEQELPYRFSKGATETAIADHGFQLWRIKPKTDVSSVTSNAA